MIKRTLILMLVEIFIFSLGFVPDNAYCLSPKSYIESLSHTMDVEDLGRCVSCPFRNKCSKKNNLTLFSIGKTSSGINPNFNITSFLKENVKRAAGCTEPAAIGYATSVARVFLSFLENDEALRTLSQGNKEALTAFLSNKKGAIDPSEIKSIELVLGEEIFKEAHSVTIAGTATKGSVKLQGAANAAKLGFFCDPKKKLAVFENVDANMKEAIKSLPSFDVQFDSAHNPLSIEVTLTDKKGKKVTVLISQMHDRVERILINGKNIFVLNESKVGDKVAIEDSVEVPKNLDQIIAISNSNVSEEIVREIWEGIFRNLQACFTGIKEEWGDQYARTQLKNKFSEEQLKEIFKDPSLLLTKYFNSFTPEELTEILSTAGSDARMGGAPITMMSTSGSGNQGVVAMIPVLIRAQTMGADIPGLMQGMKIDCDQNFIFSGNLTIRHKDIARAILLSHLVVNWAAKQFGTVGGWCGCAIKAALGSIAGIIYLDANHEFILKRMDNAMRMTLEQLGGMVCTGAKNTCANKVGEGSRCAYRNAMLAISGIEPSQGGLVGPDVYNSMARIRYNLFSLYNTSESLIKSITKLEDFVDAEKFVDEMILKQQLSLDDRRIAISIVLFLIEKKSKVFDSLSEAMIQERRLSGKEKSKAENIIKKIGVFERFKSEQKQNELPKDYKKISLIIIGTGIFLSITLGLILGFLTPIGWYACLISIGIFGVSLVVGLVLHNQILNKKIEVELIQVVSEPSKILFPTRKFLRHRTNVIKERDIRTELEQMNFASPALDDLEIEIRLRNQDSLGENIWDPETKKGVIYLDADVFFNTDEVGCENILQGNNPLKKIADMIIFNEYQQILLKKQGFLQRDQIELSSMVMLFRQFSQDNLGRMAQCLDEYLQHLEIEGSLNPEHLNDFRGLIAIINIGKKNQDVFKNLVSQDISITDELESKSPDISQILKNHISLLIAA